MAEPKLHRAARNAVRMLEALLASENVMIDSAAGRRIEKVVDRLQDALKEDN